MPRSEKELLKSFRLKTKPFLNKIERKLSNSYDFVLEEFDSYNGIPDMVLGSFSPKVKSRLENSTVDYNWVGPLTSFRKKDIVSICEFSEKFGISKRKATQVINQYQVAGYLEKIESSTFEVIREYEIMAKAIISIEGKLKNWRRAVFQAQRYKRFSNLSFVLLEGKYSNPAIENIDLFKSANVGLITMEDDKVDIKFIPEWEDLRLSQYTARIHEAAVSSIASNG
ncbi:hypothetical protein [Pelobacter seleniigenes]|uniref:hypothetical protein n=1 Tax=Pelobacter seleniigenes TaxID=407188 RepID=UPI0004A6D63D|nr:hypothetical protein [Pelobacter seleniigenes]